MTAYRWIPVIVLGCGMFAVHSSRGAADKPLRLPLEVAIPTEMGGMQATELTVREQEIQSARASEYLARGFMDASGEADDVLAEVHVCYYGGPASTKWAVAPRLCHMNLMWAVVESAAEEIRTGAGTGTVRRYLLRRDTQTAVALFWYQGRGRVEENAFRVRWNRLMDSALGRGTEEALVRVMVPVTDTQENALARAREVMHEIIPGLARALP